MKTSTKIASHAAAVTLGLSLALGIASTAEAGQGRFTFRGVEFMQSGNRVAAAQAFVAQQLPAGLPIPDAITQLKAANAFCGDRQPANAPVMCRWSMVVHPTGMELGEVTWTVRLTQDSQGRLASATVERSTTT